MFLKCPRCDYCWDYAGGRPVANCPACHYTLQVYKCTISLEEYREFMHQEYNFRMSEAARASGKEG